MKMFKGRKKRFGKIAVPEKNFEKIFEIFFEKKKIRERITEWHFVKFSEGSPGGISDGAFGRFS